LIAVRRAVMNLGMMEISENYFPICFLLSGIFLKWFLQVSLQIDNILSDAIPEETKEGLVSHLEEIDLYLKNPFVDHQLIFSIFLASHIKFSSKTIENLFCSQ
jgi:hypothetical protein